MIKPFAEAQAPTVNLWVEGRQVSALADETVASVLLREFAANYRTHGIGGNARAPYCLMGVCFECLAEIDGVPNRQACLVPVHDGMKIARQQGRIEVP